MSLALYRKYRPGTFAEVKGQEHVTDPLRQALRTGRVNHAYLFSGPRGCGKTSSARILARSLNCEKGPTPDPCGACESCVALAPTGPGHLDVIEIDAASHGGVDDARDLRERAFFAPVSARYKIYIIDEAHMVTREGFNALLKLVEEPPPHLKFIFATTEPEKVIGTIKSRTHHYPFRLMPPATLRALLEEILSSESVPYEPTALPLVVRAGAGSARDSLSILDQLLAGADDAGITYAKAVSLLGYTDGDLLDEVVDAFAAHDGARVFHTVNRVIEGGHDPRRFASDLLERFRDLVILANVPEAASSGLLDRPADELERLVAQAASMGPAELTRAAEIFNTGLTEMRGATSPRLLLELMCARVLLPAAAQGEAALLARLERLERGGAVAAMAARTGPATAVVSQPGVAGAQMAELRQAAATAGSVVPGGPGKGPAAASASGHAGSGQAAGGQEVGGQPGDVSVDQARDAAGGAPTSPGDQAADDGWPEPARPGAGAGAANTSGSATGPVTQAGGPRPAEAAAPAATQSGTGAGALQQQWPAVLAALKQRSIVVWANVSTNAQVVGVEGNLVTLGFSQVGAMKNFTGGGKDAVVAAALGDVLGGTWRVEAVVGGSPAPQANRGPQSGPPSGPTRQQAAPQPQTHTPPAAQHQSGARTSSHGSSSGQSGAQEASQPPGPAGHAAPAGGGPAAGTAVISASPGRQTTDESWPDAPDEPGPGSPPGPDPTHASVVATGAGLAAARSAAKAAAQAGPRAPRQTGTTAWPDAIPNRVKGPESDDVDPLNDADADVDELSGMALLQRELGAQLIGEIDHT
ncbi:DNA polymerase III subunit gamma and tau [Nonomuraea cavernae]|uniref:DNA polymerase III subunit gamma/tau n=1 Tax=Nonomuraea cavernae TaxID=2045107 RepID=A0A918DG41_9ACTN|nr:DNA polymerase III subunit gamma and tau [Nonomuraea cavernae]MCA2184050.1 DNA polymerase III subunit gamma and tau [Nonomuraea cavernae]GGO62167.1 DNA polymerase III subunit gamma and tau [Nonomuraea cavernae]